MGTLNAEDNPCDENFKSALFQQQQQQFHVAREKGGRRWDGERKIDGMRRLNVFGRT